MRCKSEAHTPAARGCLFHLVARSHRGAPLPLRLIHHGSSVGQHLITHAPLQRTVGLDVQAICPIYSPNHMGGVCSCCQLELVLEAACIARKDGIDAWPYTAVRHSAVAFETHLPL